MRCPNCHALNAAGAGFCIECGEPLDDRPEAEQQSADKTEWSWREKRLEIVLGLGLLVLVAGFALFSYANQEAQSSHYRAGLSALERRDFDVALSEFEAAGDYLSSDKRAEQVRERVRERDDLYAQAADEFALGRMWQAARLFAQLDQVSPSFRDTRDKLKEARRQVGSIVYRLDQSVDGGGALYVMGADGSDPQQVPETNNFSHVLSTDGRWLLFNQVECTAWSGSECWESTGTTVYLYSIEGRFTQKVASVHDLPGLTAWPDFTPDGKGVRIPTTLGDLVYALPAGTTPERGPLPTVTAQDNLERTESWRTLNLEDTGSGVALMVGDEQGLNQLRVAIEPIRPDGALFSHDGRYLLYRVCGPRLVGGAAGCAIRLVDVDASQPHPGTVAWLPYNGVENDRDSNNNITGEFTRDDRHILILSRGGGDTEALLYEIATGRLRQVGVAVAVEQGPLINLIAPGIIYWEGPNSLAFTSQPIKIPPGGKIWNGMGRDHVPGYGIRSHWVKISPGDRYALYLAGGDLTSDLGEYPLFAVPLDRPTQAAQVLRIKTPRTWFHSGYLLPEGHTLVTLIPPTPESAHGLYAYDLATGAATLLVPDAIELVGPGRRPEFGDFVGQ